MSATAAPAKSASLWEDFIDIFYAPTSVFLRRREGKFGLALLVYVLLATGVTVAARPLMQPIFDTMMSQAETKMRADNPQLSDEQIQTGRRMQERLTQGPIGIGFFAITSFVSVFLVGLLLFLAGKMFGSSATVGQATMVATYAFFPRLIGLIVGAIILYVTPPEQLTSMTAMTLSPARLVDAQAQPVLAAFLARFDLTVLWGTALLAIGLAVVGRIPRGKAFGAAAVVWLVATLSAVGQAFGQAG